MLPDVDENLQKNLYQVSQDFNIRDQQKGKVLRREQYQNEILKRRVAIQ